MSVERDIKDSYALGKMTGMAILGEEISNIINQEGDDKTDSECVEEIIQLLIKYKIYKERK